MVYLVTGRRTDDGWPFAGEVTAGNGDAAADLVRRWGVEPEFVQDIASGRIEFRVADPPDDEDGGSDGDRSAGPNGGAGSPRVTTSVLTETRTTPRRMSRATPA